MKSNSPSLLSLLNRPMIMDDIKTVEKNKIAIKIRELNQTYRNEGLPVMNGNLLYSNFLEGPNQILTCSPYRLWEYSSIFELLLMDDNHKYFLDIGGASSPLPYLLAENGFSGLAIDLQPLLVDICNYVTSVRKLSLKAQVLDITKDFSNINQKFDIVTSISVIEHVPPSIRIKIFENAHHILKPQGLFYITFDYGSYKATSTYLKHQGVITDEETESISDISELCSIILKCGFEFVGNNPLDLPKEVLDLKSSPGWRDFMWQNAMNTYAIDAKTPVRDLFKYCFKRLFHYSRAKSCRFSNHNFFRLFLRKVYN
jgi:2-polyprenyl-3-methyl-5-hydroxy-6-metoxy-1,4-benzoquinol methylase